MRRSCSGIGPHKGSDFHEPCTRPHHYPDGDGFRRIQSSGNHWLIRLIGVTGRFVSSGNVDQLSPKHPMAEAVGYALNQWDELNVLTTDGATPEHCRRFW